MNVFPKSGAEVDDRLDALAALLVLGGSFLVLTELARRLGVGY